MNITVMFIIQKLLFLAIVIIPITTKANMQCNGKFINPITDICWSCIMPITIGGIHIGVDKSVPKKRDTKNPDSIICYCRRNNVLLPGITIGFFEPVRLVDITRTPFCMVNLGGIELGSDKKKISSFNRSYDGRHVHDSFYHLHYYIYPLIYWLELLTDFTCLEKSKFDVAYMSEFDVSWNDEKLQALLNPESFLFGNPVAQAACSLDCAAATFAMPLDNLFWCAGCLGNMYPFSGANADHVGGVQSSSLLTMRILAKMHRIGLGYETATSSCKVNGALCKSPRRFTIKKSQYKMQMVNPKSSSSTIGCWPIGLSDMAYSSYNEYPNDGQDWGYLIWRKRNCCLF